MTDKDYKLRERILGVNVLLDWCRDATSSGFNTCARRASNSSTSTRSLRSKTWCWNWCQTSRPAWRGKCWCFPTLSRNTIKPSGACTSCSSRSSRNTRTPRRRWCRSSPRISTSVSGRNFKWMCNSNFLLDCFYFIIVRGGVVLFYKLMNPYNKWMNQNWMSLLGLLVVGDGRVFVDGVCAIMYKELSIK